MSLEKEESRFICDRMVGTLCRYLRIMGYDVFSANDLPAGDRKEDTKLIKIAKDEDRIILTRDAELSRRDPSRIIYLNNERIEEQIQQLLTSNLIEPVVRLTRCSICNSILILIPPEQISIYKKQNPHLSDQEINRCPQCWKPYWDGTHIDNLRKRLERITQRNHN